MGEIDPKLIARINELAHKAKVDTLTAAEERERRDLRQEYLKHFRAGFKQQIEHLQVFDKQGREVTPEKVRRIQRAKHLRHD